MYLSAGIQEVASEQVGMLLVVPCSHVYQLRRGGPNVVPPLPEHPVFERIAVDGSSAISRANSHVTEACATGLRGVVAYTHSGVTFHTEDDLPSCMPGKSSAPCFLALPVGAGPKPRDLPGS